MPNATTAGFQLGYVKESSWGVTPSSALKLLDITQENLRRNTNTTASEAMRADRNIPDIIRTGVAAQGSLNGEFSFGAFDQFIEGLLQSTFATDLGISADTISAAASDNSLNGSGGSEFSGVTVGQWVKIAGFSTAGNNGYAKVVTKTNSKLTLSGLTLTDESAGNTVTVGGQLMRNGVTGASFTIEKQFTDVSEFHAFLGMRVSTMSLTIPTSDRITCSFDFMGKDATSASSTAGSTTATAATQNQVLNSVDHVKNVRFNDNAAAGFDIAQMSLTISNNLRAQPAVGNLAAIGVGSGQFQVTGTLQAYFADQALYEDYLNFAERDISFRLEDSDGNAYVFTIPAFKFTEGDVLAGGNNQDVYAQMSFSAKLDSTTSAALQIDRFAAA